MQTLKPSDLLSKPGAWTQHVSARDANGKPCFGINPKATCWCLAGVLDKYEPSRPDKDKLFSALCEKLGLPGTSELIEWNDDPSRTQAEVVAMLQSVGL